MKTTVIGDVRKWIERRKELVEIINEELQKNNTKEYTKRLKDAMQTVKRRVKVLGG